MTRSKRFLAILSAGLMLTASAAATTALAQSAKEKRASAPATSTTSAGTGDVVAKAGDQDLTRDEVRAIVDALPPADRAALVRDPALFSQTLRVILANRLVLNEALSKKWHEQPNIAAQLQRVRDNAIVEAYLQSISGVPEGYPSEAEVQRAYDANKSALVMPRQFQLAQIFVALPEAADKDTDEKAKKKLADIQAKLKSGTDFAAVAKADSDERASGEQGGEIGWVADSQIRPEIKSQVLALTKGGVSAPIQVPGGWHIVKLLDSKDAGTAPFATVKEGLAQRLRAQRIEANRRAYLAKLLEQSPPTINELALSSVIGQAKN
ncbi:MAG: peptidylprolyl isomerase [Hyphomicrobiales bacterium]|nr:MAG: peptidylprolyl isomerase [Hyphomicrobiales bacterium]